jgi:D-aminopeptidase
MPRGFNARRRRFLLDAPALAGVAAYASESLAQQSAIEVRSGLSRRIDAIYAALDPPRTAGGVAAVIYKGELLHLKGYGSAQREFDVRWTPDTRYRVASVTKSFTATALLALEERGRLRLDDPLRKHLPDFPAVAAPITLHHLVTMTSGLWQDEVLLGMASLTAHTTLDEMYELVKRQRKLNYAPGSATTYIDTNFRLLARVIAAVTGKSYWDAMQDLVFQPLGMKSSFVAPDINRYYENQAPTYVSEKGEREPNLFAIGFQASGDGSMISTMRDLVQWLQHLRKDHASSKSLFARMTAPFKLGDGSTAYYRRGISVRQHRGLVGWGHGGFTGTDYIFWPEIDLVVANFTNSLGTVSKSEKSIQLTDAFLAENPGLAPGGASKIDPAALPLSREDVELLTGTFVDPETGYVLASGGPDPSGGSFRFELLGSDTRLAKVSERRFETPPSFWALRLSVEPAGRDLRVRHGDWPEGRPFVRAETNVPFSAADYVGHYRSDQLGICYTVARSAKGLELLVAAGLTAAQTLHMKPLARDVFRAHSDDSRATNYFALGTVSVKFGRDGGGRVRGMRLSVNHVRDVEFQRT